MLHVCATGTLKPLAYTILCYAAYRSYILDVDPRRGAKSLPHNSLVARERRDALETRLTAYQITY